MPPTKDELEQENQQLRDQVAQLQRNQKSGPNTRPTPTRPSFGLSAGTAAELEMHGKAADPFTGDRLVYDGDDPVERTSEDADFGGAAVRVVDQEEFDKRPSTGPNGTDGQAVIDNAGADPQFPDGNPQDRQ